MEAADLLVTMVTVDDGALEPALTTTTGVPPGVDIWLGLGRILLVPPGTFCVMIFMPGNQRHACTVHFI